MADTTSTTHSLKIECLFEDDDTRVITMRNPKSNISTSEITALEQMLLDTSGDPKTPLIIGDKAGAEFKRINLVISETVTTGNLDLGL